MRSAVLFLIFNRPDTTRQVFEAIRAVRPPRLYVSADGPRASQQEEATRCEEARRIATAVDWPCEVKTLFREQNLGCKVGVSSGITWFFDNEEEGIILEDDVLPLPSFFPYCEALLDRYRNDERVAMVSGCNLISHRFTPADSYFFSRYNHIWGWASWRRAWRHYDVAMSAWPIWRDESRLLELPPGDRQFAAYWREVFEAVYCGNIDTWDYQWTFACWRLGALAALPALNQTRNLGFNAEATHTRATPPGYVIASRPRPLPFPLIDPPRVDRNETADALIGRWVFGITRLGRVRRQLLRFSIFAWLSRATSAMRRRASGHQ